MWKKQLTKILSATVLAEEEEYMPDNEYLLFCFELSKL